jgi:hypothetical protein
MLYLLGEKVCICGVAEVLSLQKSLDPQIVNPQITNPQITTKIGFQVRQARKSNKLVEVCKLVDLRFAEHIYGSLQMRNRN